MFFSLEKYSKVRSLLSGRLPGQLIIQYSNRCNADCPQCSMRRSNNISRYILPKDKVKSLINQAADKGFQSLSFTGGEPLLFLDNVVELIGHADEAGISFIRTGTNGFLLRDSESPDFGKRINKLAERLASTKLYTFWISLDSAVAEDHEEMRGLPGVVKGIEKAIPIFHRYGIYPSVNLGINRNVGGKKNKIFLSDCSKDIFFETFKKSFEKFYTLASNLGFTISNACYPMSDPASETVETNRETFVTSPYGAASSEDIIVFSDDEKSLLFQALFETIPKFRNRLQIFSPRSALYSLIKKYSENENPVFPCRGGRDFFFVDSELGNIYPCGYRDDALSELPNIYKREGKKQKNCDLCDWECFRDPSDVMGPFATLFTNPFNVVRTIFNDPTFYKLLINDLRYYRACNFFNGRKAPDHYKMERFSIKNVKRNLDQTKRDLSAQSDYS